MRKNKPSNRLFRAFGSKSERRRITNNFYDLKGIKDWWALCFPELMKVDNATAWSKMPKKMDEYIRALPEFDEDVYKKIIGNEENNHEEEN